MAERRRVVFWYGLVAAALLLAATGCEQGDQGDRCNPDLPASSSECNSGLSCVTPSSCVISVCCPSGPPYSDPNCECFANPQGSACLGACNVDAAYDGEPSPDASNATDATQNGSDAAHE